jgi:hypothetical protein
MPEASVQAHREDAGRELPEAHGAGSVVSLPSSEAKGPLFRAADHFKPELEDAENLIKYAAEAGIDIGDEIRGKVLAARLAAPHGWSEAQSSELLGALTKLAALLRPVSGLSLRKCVDKKEAQTLNRYRWIAIVLAVVIVPFSTAAYVASATCEAIRKDIEAANALALTLVREFSLTSKPPAASADSPSAPPGDAAIKDLQLFAATNRALYGRAKTMDGFALAHTSLDPRPSDMTDDAFNRRFELQPEAPNLRQQAIEKLALYQTVRHYAQTVQEAALTTFGAATTCILPILYALLGACAWLLRSFEAQIKARTFTGTEKTTARFMIALIGGLVIGLFGNLGGGHSTLPPLAIAFLVGYGADVFFYFLEGLLQTITRSRAEATPPPK